MSFTKTSQKFGQWSDLRANTVYGLGFLSEAELNTFIDRFTEVKEATRGKSSNNSSSAMSTQQQQANNALLAPPNLPSSVAGDLKSKQRSSDSPPPPYNNNTEGINNNEVASLGDPMLIHGPGGLPSTESPSHHNNGTGGHPHPGGKVHNEQNQLRIENERLRAALAQSSSNASKWEVELSTLKTNNARLTAALTESTKNVEQWKRELAQFRDANARLRERALEAEARSGDKNAARELQTELSSLRDTVELLRAQTRDSQDTKQLEELNSKMGESIAEISKMQKQMQSLLSITKN